MTIFLDKATEVKHDAAVIAHDTQEKAKEVAHNVQGRINSIIKNVFVYMMIF